MITQRVVATACFLAGCGLYLAGSGHEFADAYVFPNLLAIVMAVLGVIMAFTTDIDPETKKSVAIMAVPWDRLWPVLLIFLVYMWVAEYLGFFVSSFLAFVAIGTIYAPSIGWLWPPKLRCVPIALLFLSLLYGLFVVLLKVQLPSGLLL